MSEHDSEDIRQRMVNAYHQAEAQVVEVCRMYENFLLMVQEGEPWPPDLEVLLSDKRLSIERHLVNAITMFEHIHAIMTVTLDDLATSQLKRWVDGLDEELRSLGRE